MRGRNENDNRDFNSDTGFKSFNPMRTQLGVSVTPVEDMKVFLQVQDSRILGLEASADVRIYGGRLRASYTGLSTENSTACTSAT